MRDQHSLAAIALLHPKVRVMFQSFIEAAEAGLGIKIRIVQGLRTFQEQQAIYNQGRTTPGEIVTHAQAGESYHNYGLAIDLVPFKTGTTELNWNYAFEKIVPFAAKYGITWGGTFPSPDRDHFENKLGHNWRDLLALYNAGNFIVETDHKYVNI